jgi:DNA-binding NarL/FixJ family response regulator
MDDAENESVVWFSDNAREAMIVNTSAKDSPASVVIVEDHSLIRDGLRMLLALERNFQLVGEAGSVVDARRIIADKRPSIAMVDVGLPDGDGIALAADLIAADPLLRVLVLTGDLSPETVARALAVGAHGYVHKQHNADELFAALGALREGGRYVSRSVAASYVTPVAANKASSPLAKLTDREREIVALLCEGDSSKHVARKLDLSVATVRKHRENIMAKLDVHNVAELIAIALKVR